MTQLSKTFNIICMFVKRSSAACAISKANELSANGKSRWLWLRRRLTVLGGVLGTDGLSPRSLAPIDTKGA